MRFMILTSNEIVMSEANLVQLAITDDEKFNSDDRLAN
jgi:hypothetical protein